MSHFCLFPALCVNQPIRFATSQQATTNDVKFLGLLFHLLPLWFSQELSLCFCYLRLLRWRYSVKRGYRIGSRLWVWCGLFLGGFRTRNERLVCRPRSMHISASRAMPPKASTLHRFSASLSYILRLTSAPQSYRRDPMPVLPGSPPAGRTSIRPSRQSGSLWPECPINGMSSQAKQA